LCRALLERREALGGLIEIASLKRAESRKGQRGIDRPARRRRWPRSLLIPKPVRIVVGVDRRARLASGVAGPMLSVQPRDLERILGPSLTDAPPIVLAPEGRLGAAARFARARGGVFRDVRSVARPQELHHNESAGAYLRRFVIWERRFRGVATKYLEHYLAWHRSLDHERRQGLRENVLRWPQRLPSSPTVPANRSIASFPVRSAPGSGLRWRLDSA
jgi:hypothetical protein